MNRAMRAAGLAVVAVLATGCGAGGDQAVHVRIQFTDPNPAHVLHAVSVISGGDKFSWPQLAGGDVRTVTLHPGQRDDRQLTLLFRLSDRSHAWDGPKVAAGVGYCIHLVVDAEGRTSHRHRPAPCHGVGE